MAFNVQRKGEGSFIGLRVVCSTGERGKMTVNVAKVLNIRHAKAIFLLEESKFLNMEACSGES